jgi:hypothetical protein
MLYFAYGSDLNPAQMAEVCPGYRSLGVARLADFRLTFPRFSRAWNGGVAGLEPSPGDAVFGALYDVPADEVPVMHYHRGYDPAAEPEANEHLFGEVAVRRLATGETVAAWTYFAVPDGGEAAQPSAAYMNAILDGAHYHGLPRAYVVVLERIRTA